MCLLEQPQHCPGVEGRQPQHVMLPQGLVSAPRAEIEKQTREDLRESQSHLQNQDRKAPKLSLQSL